MQGGSSQEILNILIRLGLDKASPAEVAKEFQQVRAEAEKSLDMERLLGKNTEATRRWMNELRSVEDEYRNIAKASADVKEPGAPESGGQRDSGGFGQNRYSSGFAEIMLGRGLTTLGAGDLGQAVLAAGDIQRTIDIMKQLGAASGGMGAALGSLLGSLLPVTAAITALMAVVNNFNQIGQEARQAINGALEAQHRYNTEIGTLTDQELHKKLEAARNSLAAEEKTLSDLQALYDKKRNMTMAGGGADDQAAQFFVRLLGSATPGALGQTFGDMEQKIKEAQKAVSDASVSVGLYSNAIDENATAARDAAIAVLQFVDALANIEVAGDALIRAGKTGPVFEQIHGFEDKINAAEREKDRLSNLTESEKTADGAIEKMKALTAQQEIWQKNIDDLRDRVLPAAAATEVWNKNLADNRKLQEENARETERLAKAHNDDLRQINDLMAAHNKQVQREEEDQRIQDERDAVTKEYRDKIQAAKDAEAEQARQEKLQKLRADAADKQAKDDQRYNDRIDELNRSYMERRFKEWQEFLVKELRSIEDFEIDRRRTLEDANDQLHEAAANRDVAEFIRIERETQKKLVRMQEDASLEDRRRTEDYNMKAEEDRRHYQAELTDLAAQHEKERAENLRALNQRLADEQQAAINRHVRSQQLEQEFANLRETWAQQDRARMAARRDQDYHEQLNRLIMHDNDVLREIDRVGMQMKAAMLMQPMLVPGATFSQPNYNPMQGAPSGPTGPASWTSLNTVPLPSVNVHGFSEYASGLDDVPYDWFPAMLHKHEKVLTSSDAERYRGGSGRGGGVQVSATIELHDAATKAELESGLARMADRISDRLERLGEN